MSKLAQYNKTIVVVLGLILLVGSDVANNLNDLLPTQWITTLNVALGLLTAFLAFWVKNEPLIEDLGRDVAQPSLGNSVDAVAKVSELTADIRASLARLHSTSYPMYTSVVPSPAPREVAPVSVVVNTPAAPVDVPAAAEPAPAAAQEAPVPDPAPVPEPSAPTGTYPDGPYVPPKPSYTGPIPPVSEPVGATAVSAAP